MKNKNHTLLLILFLFVFSGVAQNSLWKKTKETFNTETLSIIHLDKNKVEIFELNKSVLDKNLSLRSNKNTSKNSSSIISLPQKNGNLQTFKVFEKSVFSPSLAKKYPNIKSYVGYSLDNPSVTLRMSVSPQGIQTMVIYPNKPIEFMQPVSKGSNKYVVYDKSSKASIESFQCATNTFLEKEINTASKVKINEGGANDQILRKFRLAVTTNSEYTAYHDDGDNTNGNAIADALAAINATITRVNQVFETDMAITFELIDAPQLIYNDVNTDPYSGFTNPPAWSREIQDNLTDVIGNGAYDIGHMFARSAPISSAGCLACICEDDLENGNPYKGSGYTGAIDGIPEGDSFDISYVAHEIGHQLGANHTGGYISENTGVNSEPGSGSTIMSYAGATGADDLQLESDPYFHYNSIKQILNNVRNSSSCWQSNSPATITNNPPVANAGRDYNIPAGTAYILKGSATDVDGLNNLTYCWEQTDSSVGSNVVAAFNFGSTLTIGSVNRSLPPSNSPERYIPRFSSVVAGNTTQTNPTVGSDWETASTVARDLNWALTVRDRTPINAGGGQSSFDTMKITVENTVPFTVNNPSSWGQGTNQTIQWVVGDTDNGTINCQRVNIKLSTDGGATFPITVASNILNNGSFLYTVPAIADTSSARLLIEAVDNIFYDVSDFNFSISNAPSFFINQTDVTMVDCETTTVTYTFDFVVDNGFSENTVFSATGNPLGTSVVFLPANRSTTGTFTMIINDIDAQGHYDILLTGTSNSITKNIPVDLSIFKHCAVEADNDPEFFAGISSVKFNTINNASGKMGGYTSYHKVSTIVNKESSYNLDVNVVWDYDDIEVRAWIDWNKDCDFDDPGESYDLGLAPESGIPANNMLSILVPKDAVLGATVLRIGSATFASGFNIEACDDSLSDGEWEDYTINVEATLGISAFEFDDFKVFPNPNKGQFTIELNGLNSSNINLAVYDIRGRSIYNNSYKAKDDFTQSINLNTSQSGLYLLKVSDGLRTSTKKIIIE